MSDSLRPHPNSCYFLLFPSHLVLFPAILHTCTLFLKCKSILCMCVRMRAHSVSQSCRTICNPMDCSHQAPLFMGFFQARRSPGGGDGNLFQFSCLEKSHGRRSLVATAHGVANSLTWLGDWICAQAHTHKHTHTHTRQIYILGTMCRREGWPEGELSDLEIAGIRMVCENWRKQSKEPRTCPSPHPTSPSSHAVWPTEGVGLWTRDFPL